MAALQRANGPASLSRERVEGLLRNGTRGAIGVNGTCTNAAIELFQSGVLRREGEDIHLQGELYFAPFITDPNTRLRMRRLIEEFLTNPEPMAEIRDLELTPAEVIKDFMMQPREAFLMAAGYAYAGEFDAWEAKYSSLIGRFGLPFEKFIPYSQRRWTSKGKRGMQDEFGLRHEDVERLHAIVATMRRLERTKRGGIIIALKREVAELGMTVDTDTYASLAISVPNGLSVDYIQGLVPINANSKKAVAEFLEAL